MSLFCMFQSSIHKLKGLHLNNQMTYYKTIEHKEEGISRLITQPITIGDLGQDLNI